MREVSYLRARYRALVSYTGALIAVIGVLHLVPLIVLAFYPEETPLAGGFLIASLPLIVIGVGLFRIFSPREPLSLTVQEGSVIVVLIWILASLAGAIPFLALTRLNFTQAFFESVSGWTTTGLSVIDVTSTPRILLFFRSFIQLAGGAGFAIIALSAAAGSIGTGLVAAEGRTDQLAPHVRHSASIVLRIYLGYIAFGVVALKAAGMGWFDAVNHAFTAVATGGFSTKPNSIAHWDNPAIEAVIIVLMLLGSINFFIAYTLLQGKLRAVLQSGELRLMATLLLVGGGLLLAVVTLTLYPSLEMALRVAAFEVVSALSGAGLTITTYERWLDFGFLILILLMLTGGGVGSTAGGIKLIRVYILYKAIVWEVRRAFMPRHMINEPAIWQGEKRELLNDRQVRQNALFIGMYLVVLIVGTAVMTAYGYGLRDSLFEFASSLGTVGLTVGVTRADMPPLVMWVQSGGMLLGRLEIFAVIIGILKLLSDAPTLVGLDRSARRS